MPVDQLIRRSLAGLGDVLLIQCVDRCPVIGFENRPGSGDLAGKHSFAPADFMVPIQAEDPMG